MQKVEKWREEKYKNEGLREKKKEWSARRE